ncbi:enoyl-CoA hydratase/carnithine racemase [Oceanococcus atlanticus]|uniref:Enoyl-CoA hydratase/carnithine racemase n=1 Tax=Oceanococcus atlanticus TaxID=1317117 RepID=A0A1Y1SCV1_9GAMM|nr:enoyl-CoA hydratase/isomerase family protein [Oceanococcus atlanticus]ORE86837.1 enoyl-CoA hydratase/carnithine racemase [Oceanococcus atlanticus]
MIREILIQGRGPNILSHDNLQSMNAALEEAASDPIVLVGAGHAFSAGIDTSFTDVEQTRQVITLVDEFVERLFLHPAPTVAAINGHAIAGGCLLAQACDQRVLSRGSKIRIGMPGVALGIRYPPRALRLLRYRVPSASLETLLLGAAIHEPERALALGLVDMVVDDALSVAHRQAASMSAWPRHAYWEAKRALRGDALCVPVDEQAAFDREFAEYWDPEKLNSARRQERTEEH